MQTHIRDHDAPTVATSIAQNEAKVLHCQQKYAIMTAVFMPRPCGADERGTGSLWTKMNYCP
jgi:hypothetical protein